jgi:hypothetical protein
MKNTKNTSISSNEKEMANTFKHYQWIKGEKLGQSVYEMGESFSDGERTYVKLSDGSTLNADLFDEFLSFIYEGEPVQLQPLNDVVETPLNRVEPIRNPVEYRMPEEQILPAPSPIEAILSTSKKKKTTMDVKIVADIPPVELMKVLSETHENGEEEIKRYLERNAIDANEVLRQVASQIWLGMHTKKRNNRTEE